MPPAVRKPDHAFSITQVLPGQQEGQIYVLVSYSGGALILPYRATLPLSNIRAQVRAEVRRRNMAPASQSLDRFQSLIGEYEV